MDSITLILIASLALNGVLAVVLALQQVRITLATSAMRDLLDRVAKLETAARTPQKIVIVDKNKELTNEQNPA